MHPNEPLRIAAASVNHNTSAYMELMLRSLFAHHTPGPWLSLTLFDNGSTDDMDGLRAAAAHHRVPITPSGYPLATLHNSHGDVLRRFVLNHPEPDYYLFLDADVCFIADNTIQIMAAELAAAPGAFGIGPRMSWDGVNEMPRAVRQDNPDINDARLHPCCALVRNTPLFRMVAEQIGLGCARLLHTEREQFLDTFKLMTMVMHTHNLVHAHSSAMVQHFFCTSYVWDDEALVRHKTGLRDRLLAALRAGQGG